MGDYDCRQHPRIFPGLLQALEGLTAGNTRIHQNPRAGGGNQRAIAPAAAGKNGDSHSHAGQHTFLHCGSNSNYQVSRYLLTIRKRAKTNLGAPGLAAFGRTGYLKLI